MYIIGERKLNFMHNNIWGNVGDWMMVSPECARMLKSKTQEVSIIGITDTHIYVRVINPYLDSRVEYALPRAEMDDWFINIITPPSVDDDNMVNPVELKTVYAPREKEDKHPILATILIITTIFVSLLFRQGWVLLIAGAYLGLNFINEDKEKREYIVYNTEIENEEQRK